VTRERATELANDLGVAPSEIERAVALLRSGRADLVEAVMAKKMTVRAALATAHGGGRDA
jgi:hypothetical protein